MKRMMILCLLLGNDKAVFSDWKLGTIYNNSDLKFESAWRNKSKQKKKGIPSITDALRATLSLPHQRIVKINYIISQDLGTFSILASDGKQKYDIFFDSQATHSIAWQRSKTQVITPSLNNQGCSIADGTNCARVWIPIASVKEIVATQAYDIEKDEPIPTFDLTIGIKNGHYALALSEPEPEIVK